MSGVEIPDSTIQEVKRNKSWPSDMLRKHGFGTSTIVRERELVWSEKQKETILSSNNDVVLFKRDPYERFISGFDRFEPGRGVSKKTFHFDSRMSEEENEDLFNSKLKGGNINFDEYVDFILQIPKEYVDPHFKPQSFGAEDVIEKLSQLDKKRKCLFFDIKDFSEGVSDFIISNFPDFRKEDLTVLTKDFYPRTKESGKRKTLSPEQKERVYNYYKEDFRLLGYSK